MGRPDQGGRPALFSPLSFPANRESARAGVDEGELQEK